MTKCPTCRLNGAHVVKLVIHSDSDFLEIGMLVTGHSLIGSPELARGAVECLSSFQSLLNHCVIPKMKTDAGTAKETGRLKHTMIASTQRDA